MLKQQHLSHSNKSIALRNVLRSYRWSPHTSTGSSPANLLFRHSIRTEFDIMKPTSSSTKSSLPESKFVVGQLSMDIKISTQSSSTMGQRFYS